MYAKHCVSLIVMIASLIPSVCFSTTPRHSRELKAAWEAFDVKKWETVIKHAKIINREFGRQAVRDQDKLSDSKSKILLGAVSDEQKQEIHKNGLLNDVATANYLLLRAADQLGRKDVVKKAFATVSMLPSARAWDPRGWFWSPIEAARIYNVSPELADKTPHEVYTIEAWSAFNRGAYEQAIIYSEKCIKQFQKSAIVLQETLKKRKEIRPIGVVSEKVKKMIFTNGILNDVSTCFYIKGEASRIRGDNEAAASAFHDCKKLSYGRCWDPNGWFWSPAVASGDKLEQLR